MTLPLPLRRWFGLQALILLILLAAAGLARAQAGDPPTRVLRVVEVQGQAQWFDAEERSWQPLLRNQSLAEGDRLRLDGGSRVGLRVGLNSLWLDEGAALELLRLDEERFEVALDRGALALRWITREAAREAAVRTPEGRFGFDRSGDYRIDALGRSSRAQVFSGRLYFEHRGQDGAPIWADDPESLEVWWEQGGPRAERSRAAARSDRFGQWLLASLDFGRGDLDRYASRPAYRYVSPEMTGADELDAHGRWESTAEFGAVWIPTRVAVDWAPFRHGRWTWRIHWGWVWVDDLPWGYATSHYGRWVHWGNRWCWTPGGVRVGRPVFAPALVAWVNTGNVQIGINLGGGYRQPPVAWYPLAPYQVYTPWYRHSPGYARRFNPDPDPHTVRRPQPPQGWAGHNRGVPGAVSTFGPTQGQGAALVAVGRPVPLRDEAVLRAVQPLPQGPSRTVLPMARGQDEDAPRMRAGGGAGLPMRGAEVPQAQPSPMAPAPRPSTVVPQEEPRLPRAWGRDGDRVQDRAPERLPERALPTREPTWQREGREPQREMREPQREMREPDGELPRRRLPVMPQREPETPRPAWQAPPAELPRVQRQQEMAPAPRMEAPRPEMPMRRAEPPRQEAPREAPRRERERQREENGPRRGDPQR